MPERVKDLSSFLREIADLIGLISECREVLFRAEFRRHIPESAAEAISRLRVLAEHEYLRDPERFEEMRGAGLYGAQLELKLESFESALVLFRADGGLEQLEDALDKGGVVLASLAGAIPGFGSFAQELVEFLLKELRRRLWRR